MSVYQVANRLVNSEALHYCSRRNRCQTIKRETTKKIFENDPTFIGIIVQKKIYVFMVPGFYQKGEGNE